MISILCDLGEHTYIHQGIHSAENKTCFRQTARETDGWTDGQTDMLNFEGTLQGPNDNSTFI